MNEATSPNPATGAAAGPPAAPSPAAPPAASPPPAGGAPNDWRASFAPELREAASLAKFQDAGALAKSYVELEKKMGAKLAPPAPDAPPEAQAAWRAAIGVPDKPEGYALAAPEGVPAEAWDGERANAFAGLAHQLGLTPAQAKGIADWAAKDAAGALEKMTAGIEADGRPMEDVLRAEWGGQYDVQVDRAKRAASEFGDETALAALEAKIGGAALVRMFAKIGAAVAEDAPAGMGTGRQASFDPVAERKKYFTPGTPENEAYTKPLHPEHQAAQKRVRDLFALEAERVA